MAKIDGIELLTMMEQFIATVLTSNFIFYAEQRPGGNNVRKSLAKSDFA